MNDFQSVKQREGAGNFCDQDDHALARGPTLVSEIAAFDNVECDAISAVQQGRPTWRPSLI
jgi:hypothetical protein